MDLLRLEFIRDFNKSDISRWHSVIKVLYGDVPWGQVYRIAWLSCLLAVIIGGFWILDSLKDSVFERTVGMEYQPKAKLLSVVVMLFLLLVYNQLVDSIRARHKLFYVVGSFYATLFWLISMLLDNSSIGLANKTADPYRVIGWISYVAIESYGSIIVALFWGFTNASVNLEEAQSMYGLTIAGAQIGAIVGSTIASNVSTISLVDLYRIACCTPMIMIAMIWGYVQMFGSHLPHDATPTVISKESSSFHTMWDGLLLIFKYPYVSIILAISCIDEIVLTVLDYEMKIVGIAHFQNREKSDELFTMLLARFGQVTNVVSLLISLLGTSFVVRRLGVRCSLLVFPTLLTFAVLLCYWLPILWVLFVCVSMLKGLTYSLNEPCHEMLYLPTTDTIKFKCKTWIDVFGARCAKAIGSMITNKFKNHPRRLVTYGGLPNFIICIIFLVVSIVAGHMFDNLIKTKEMVGPNDDDNYLEREKESIEAVPLLTDDMNDEECFASRDSETVAV